jgi:hypothetical protein
MDQEHLVEFLQLHHGDLLAANGLVGNNFLHVPQPELEFSSSQSGLNDRQEENKEKATSASDGAGSSRSSSLFASQQRRIDAEVNRQLKVFWALYWEPSVFF